jgi:hypothetical protein
MKCLYCHENVQPSGDTCPQCGLPLIEDHTLMEIGAPSSGLAGWLAERKPIVLAAGGGFLAAVLIGAITLAALSGAQSGEMTAQATTPTPEPTRVASRTPITSYSAPTPAPVSASVTPAPVSTDQPVAARPEAPAPRVPGDDVSAAPTVPAEPAPPAGAEPPPLPANFEYDPQWGFPAPPRPVAPARKKADPVLEPTAPGHVLAMNPRRRRDPQFVMIVPNRGTVDNIAEANSTVESVSLPPIGGN